MSSKDARKVAALSKMMERQSRVVPDGLAYGAEEAQRKNALSGKKLKLDIMAKRRTDEDGGGSSGS